MPKNPPVFKIYSPPPHALTLSSNWIIILNNWSWVYITLPITYGDKTSLPNILQTNQCLCTGKVLPTLASQSARKVAALVQEGKGKFSLKISLDPFTEKDVKVAVDHGAVRVTGSRGESTGVRIQHHHHHYN